jgi:5-methylcytosine-specific restriction endonuclease McrA
MKAKKDTNLNRWQKEYSGVVGVCPRCKQAKENTIDHIIPVYLLEQLGLHDACVNDTENFELTCYTCNKFKAGRIDLANLRTIPLLKKYINSL